MHDQLDGDQHRQFAGNALQGPQRDGDAERKQRAGRGRCLQECQHAIDRLRRSQPGCRAGNAQQRGDDEGMQQDLSGNGDQRLAEAVPAATADRHHHRRQGKDQHYVETEYQGRRYGRLRAEGDKRQGWPHIADIAVAADHSLHGRFPQVAGVSQRREGKRDGKGRIGCQRG